MKHLLFLILLNFSTQTFAQCYTDLPSDAGIITPPQRANGFDLTTWKEVNWGRSVLRVEFMGGTAEQREEVRKYALEWSQKTNVRFIFHVNYKSHIRIAFEDQVGSYSQVGNLAKKVAANEHTMNFQWIDKRTVLHEFGHALGFMHEHLRPDLNIQWDKERVYADVEAHMGWSKAKIDFNILKPLSLRDMIYSRKDPKSIMTYPVPQEWTKNDFEIPAIEKLSALDIQFTNEVYKKTKSVAACKNYGTPILFDEFNKQNSDEIVSWQHHCSDPYNFQVTASDLQGRRIWQHYKKTTGVTESLRDHSWIQTGEFFSPQYGVMIHLEPYGEKTKKDHTSKVKRTKLILSQGEGNMLTTYINARGQTLRVDDWYMGQGKFHRLR